MTRPLSSTDQLILDCLLTKLLGYLDGAVEMWTLVCLGTWLDDRRGFLLENSDLMRAVFLVTRALLQEAANPGQRSLASEPPIDRSLDHIEAAHQKLHNAFLILEQFRTVPLSEVRQATDAIAEAHNELREAVQQLSKEIELSLTYWKDRTSEREAYYHRILAGLFELCVYHRNAEQPEAATTTP